MHGNKERESVRGRTSRPTRRLEMRRYPSGEARRGGRGGERHQAALIRGICSRIDGSLGRSLAWVMSQHDALATNYSRSAVDRREDGRGRKGRRIELRRNSGIIRTRPCSNKSHKRWGIPVLQKQAKILKLVVQMFAAWHAAGRNFPAASPSSFIFSHPSSLPSLIATDEME